MLIRGRIVMVFAILLSNGGSSLVEHTRQDPQAAKADSRAARRTKGEISGGNRGAHFGVWRLAFVDWISSSTFCFRETFFKDIIGNFFLRERSSDNLMPIFNAYAASSPKELLQPFSFDPGELGAEEVEDKVTP